MTPLAAALFGLLGGAAVEGLEFAATTRRMGDWPWRRWRNAHHRRTAELGPDLPMLFATHLVFRLGGGSLAAYALAAGDQINGVLGAFGIGMAGSLALQWAGLTGARGGGDSSPTDDPSMVGLAPAPRRAATPRRAIRAAGIGSIVISVSAVLFTVIAWLDGRHGLIADGTSPGGDARASPATPSARLPPSPNSARLVHLAGLTPEAGGSNIGRLPGQLTGRKGYENAVVIPCPANRPDEQLRHVKYDLDRRYLDFHAMLAPFSAVPKDTGVRFEILLDNRRTLVRDVRVNTMDPLDMVVVGDSSLELRITCEVPDDTAVLMSASLLRAG